MIHIAVAESGQVHAFAGRRGCSEVDVALRF